MSAPDERSRSNGIWTWEADYLPMWHALWGSSTKVSDEELAATLGRSLRAVRARARELTTAGSCFAGGGLPGMRKTKRLSVEQFRAAVHTYCHGEGIPLWDNRADQKLRAAWAAGWPDLGHLAELVGATEQQLVNRLITLGLAAGVVEAADHLGATPGGVVDTNARFGRDRQSTAVWVLVITGPDGGVEVTTHPDEHAAWRSAAATTEPLNGRPVRWHISENLIGETYSRTHHSGVGLCIPPRKDSA